MGAQKRQLSLWPKGQNQGLKGNQGEATYVFHLGEMMDLLVMSVFWAEDHYLLRFRVQVFEMNLEVLGSVRRLDTSFLSSDSGKVRAGEHKVGDLEDTGAVRRPMWAGEWRTKEVLQQTAMCRSSGLDKARGTRSLRIPALFR